MRMIGYSFDSAQLARVYRYLVNTLKAAPFFKYINPLHLSRCSFRLSDLIIMGCNARLDLSMLDSIVAAVDSIIPASSVLYIELAHARKNTQLLPLRRTRKMADLYTKSRDEAISREIDHFRQI